VESQEEEDMPERLLGSISLHHLDHNAAHPNTFRRKSTGGSSSVSAGVDNTDGTERARARPLASSLHVSCLNDCNGGCQKDQLSYESEGRIRHDLESVGASSCSAEAWLASLTEDEHGGALPSLSASTLAATNIAAEGRAVGLLERLRQWGTVGE
ncbi:hypothetical protein FOZ63_014553, partial [Perkinsus olseni]